MVFFLFLDGMALATLVHHHGGELLHNLMLSAEVAVLSARIDRLIYLEIERGKEGRQEEGSEVIGIRDPTKS
jgi:hypothetical protein